MLAGPWDGAPVPARGAQHPPCLHEEFSAGLAVGVGRWVSGWSEQQSRPDWQFPLPMVTDVTSFCHTAASRIRVQSCPPAADSGLSL